MRTVKRAMLLVVGGRLPEGVVERIGAWWRSGAEDVLLVTSSSPTTRLVLVDLGALEVVADTDRDGAGLVALNLPDGAEGEDLRAALEGAQLLGAPPEELWRLLEAALRREPPA